MLPAVVPSSPEVTANANWSADSSQMNDTLSSDPLLKNRPWSNVLADPPELFFANVKSGSSIVNVALSIVVVVPFTVKLPSTEKLVETFTSPDESAIVMAAVPSLAFKFVACTFVAVAVVKVPAAALAPPIVVPSMAPPLMSAVSVVRVTPVAIVIALLTVISSELSVVATFMYTLDPSLISIALALLSSNNRSNPLPSSELNESTLMSPTFNAFKSPRSNDPATTRFVTVVVPD